MIDIARFLVNYLSGKKIACSIDVTSRCNLKCKHCYWQFNKKTGELSLIQLEKLMSRTREYLDRIVITGGEPLLRPTAVYLANEIFPQVAVVSNGTLPLLEIPNRYFISLDGVNVRGKLFERVKENTWEDSRVIGTITLCQENKDQIREIAEIWSKSNISTLIYNFYTPFQKNDPLWIPFEERKPLLKEISTLFDELGWFILNPLKCQKEFEKKQTKRRSVKCAIEKYVISFDSEGQIKLPCVLGKGVICERCGCHTGIYMSNYKTTWGFKMTRMLH